MKRSRSPQVAASRFKSSLARAGGNAAATHSAQSRGEGPVCQERNPTLPAQRQLPLLHVPIEQVVGPLVRDHGRDLQRTRELAVGGITESNPQGLSLLLQRVQLLEPLLPAFERF